nr:EAL domain-containing protein [uncultured Desulfuromonas sp.]
MRAKLKITAINLFATILTSIFLSVSVGYFLILQPLSTMKDNVAQVQKNYMEQQKQLVKDNVDLVVEHMRSSRKLHLDDVRLELEQKLALIHRLSSSLNLLDISSELKQQSLSRCLFDSKWIHGAGSTLLVGRDRRIIQDSLSQGSFVNKQHADERKQLYESLHVLVDTCFNHPDEVQWLESTFSYENKTPKNLLSLSAYLKELDCVAVVSMDLDDAMKHVQKDVIELLSNERFGHDQYGYYFVVNAHDQLILNPAHSPSYHDDLSALPQSDENKALFRQLKNISRQSGQAFFRYDYVNPNHDNQLEEKQTYVVFFSPWNWTLGAGFYMTEHKKQLEEGILLANRASQEKINQGIWLLALNLLFGLTVALYVNRHINRLDHNRQAHMHELEQYKKLLDLSCMVSKGDLKGHITYTNESFQQVTGYTAEEMLGKPHNLFRHPSTPKKVFKELWDTIQAGKVWRGSSKNLGKNGKPFYTQQVIMPITDDTGEILEYIAARYDITELLEKREQLQLAFSTDTVTALGSRFKLLRDIERGPASQCLALIDMASFHGVNKLYGTDVGDSILKYIGESLSLYYGGSKSTLYRLNADVFAVLSPTTEGFSEQLKSFLDLFSQKNFPLEDEKNTEVPVTLTAGIACCQENLLTCSDSALKEAKRKNKQLMIYNQELADSDEYKQKMYWIDTVQQAMTEGRLVAYYQPIIDLSSGQICKFETLMRLLDRDGKPVAPGLFLPVLKQTHFYAYMTHAMIEQACAFFKDKHCHFSINFTVDDLLRKETVQLIVDTALRYDVIDRLVLEVVETENIQNYDQALDTIRYLKGLGCQISIDDFGSGYSNFSYLTQVSADVIKIDGSLIQEINKDERTRELISSIIQFAHRSQMKVVAEFIDSEAILQSVKEIGCDMGQGYHFSPPLAASEIPPCPEPKIVN